MAVVILGGIVTSTALNMIVLPALYVKYGHAAPMRRREEPALGATAAAIAVAIAVIPYCFTRSIEGIANAGRSSTTASDISVPVAPPERIVSGDSGGPGG